MACSTRLRYFAASTQGKHGSTRLKHFTAQLLWLRLRLPGLLPGSSQRKTVISLVQVKLWYPLTRRAIPERLRDFIYGRFISRHCLYLYFSLKGARKRDKPRKAWTKVLGVHMNEFHYGSNTEWRVLGNDNLYSRYWNSKDIYRRTRSKLRIKAIYKHRTINQKMLVIITYDHGKLKT